jgi:hypothetical protein
MKDKLMLSLLFISFFANAVAQKYESCFGAESTKWIIVNPNSFWGIESPSIPYYYTIDSIKCYGWYNNEQSDGVVYYETDENSKLLRWDMKTNKKSIIMDLNWIVGDTVFIDQEALKEMPDVIPFTIVDSVYLDSNNRKVIQTQLVLHIDTIYFNLKYIEGVGPNSSIFILEEYGFFWRMSDLLLCTYKDDILVYTNTDAGGECTYKKPVSFKSIQKAQDIKVSFLSNTIELTFDDTFSGTLCLISTNGKVIKKVNVNRNNKSIDIKEVPDGFYIIQVTNRTGKYCITQKITKTK